MTKGIKNIDPVQGLVDYVLDIKPYHSKIVEVLLEYVHTDTIDTTILDTANFGITIDRPFNAQSDQCLDGFDTKPFDIQDPGFPVITLDVTNNSFIIPGDYAREFPVNTNIYLTAFYIDPYTDEKTVSSSDHKGTFTVDNVVFHERTVFAQEYTEIFIKEDITDPLPPSTTNTIYDLELYPAPLDVVGEIGNSIPTPPPNETPNENQVLNIGSNMFVVDGNYTSRFYQGYRFIVDGGLNQGVYTTLYSDYVGTQTRIRVAEEIPHVGTGSPIQIGGGRIKEYSLGFDPVEVLCEREPEGSLVAYLDETLRISGAGITGTDNVDITITEDSYTMDIKTYPQTTVSSTIGDSISSDSNLFEFSDQSTTSTQTNATITDSIQFDWYVGVWFQYPILSVDENLQTVTVAGDATKDIQIGQTFDIIQSASNDGVYEVRFDEQYQTAQGTSEVYFNGSNTIIAVYGTNQLTDISPYGYVENDGGPATLTFKDYIGAGISEETEAVVLTTSGSLIDSWDYQFWDVGSYDGSGVVLNLYSGTY